MINLHVRFSFGNVLKPCGLALVAALATACQPIDGVSREGSTLVLTAHSGVSNWGAERMRDAIQNTAGISTIEFREGTCEFLDADLAADLARRGITIQNANACDPAWRKPARPRAAPAYPPGTNAGSRM